MTLLLKQIELDNFKALILISENWKLFDIFTELKFTIINDDLICIRSKHVMQCMKCITAFYWLDFFFKMSLIYAEGSFFAACKLKILLEMTWVKGGQAIPKQGWMLKGSGLKSSSLYI